MLLLVSGVIEAEEPETPAPEDRVLLTDSLGHVVACRRVSLPQSLLPPAKVGLERQVSEPAPGAAARRVEQRIGRARHDVPPLPGRCSRASRPTSRPWTSSATPPSRRALSSSSFRWNPTCREAKYQLERERPAVLPRQTVNSTACRDAMAGASDMGYYTLDLHGKWAVYDSPAAGNAGWISLQIYAKTGMGRGPDRDARTNLGTLTNPTGTCSASNDFRIPELAWQQWLGHGEIVAVAGASRKPTTSTSTLTRTRHAASS